MIPYFSKYADDPLVFRKNFAWKCFAGVHSKLHFVNSTEKINGILI